MNEMWITSLLVSSGELIIWIHGTPDFEDVGYVSETMIKAGYATVSTNFVRKVTIVVMQGERQWTALEEIDTP